MSGSLFNIIDAINRKWGISLAAVQLIDSHLCMDASKYLAGLLHSLATMLHLELPMVNVLSKIDVLQRSLDSAMEREMAGRSDEADDDGGGGPSGRGRHDGDVGVELGLEFCIEGLDLWRLPPLIHTYRKSANSKYRKLAERLCEVIEDYSLVTFVSLDVHDDASLGAVLALVDKSVGFVDSAFGQMQYAFNEQSLRESFLQQRSG